MHQQVWASLTFSRQLLYPLRGPGRYLVKLDLRLRLQGLGLRVGGLGCEVDRLGLRIEGLGLRV